MKLVRERRRDARTIQRERREIADGAAELKDAHLATDQPQARSVAHHRVEPAGDLESERRRRGILKQGTADHWRRGV